MSAVIVSGGFRLALFLPTLPLSLSAGRGSIILRNYPSMCGASIFEIAFARMVPA